MGVKIRTKFFSENLGLPDTIVIGHKIFQSVLITDFAKRSK